MKGDEKANASAFSKVRADKEREVSDGHDGTWVAHPGMVQLVTDIFNENMKTANQIDRKREDVSVSREDLLEVPAGNMTEQGLRTNITVGVNILPHGLLDRELFRSII